MINDKSGATLTKKKKIYSVSSVFCVDFNDILFILKI